MSNLRQIVDEDASPTGKEISIVTLDSFVEDLLVQAKESNQTWEQFFGERHANTCVTPEGNQDLMNAMKRVWDTLKG